MQSFSQLGVSRAAVNALSADGIEQPFPIQEMVIGDVLAGHDVLVRSPTGSTGRLGAGDGVAAASGGVSTIADASGS